MKKIINPIYLPSNLRVIDSGSTKNLTASSQLVTNNIIDQAFVEQFPLYIVDEDDRLINITASDITTPYDYTAIGSNSTEYNAGNAFPLGSTAKYNRKIVQIELPKASETDDMILWVNAVDISNDWIAQIIPANGDTIQGDSAHLEINATSQALQLLLSSGQWYIVSAYNFLVKRNSLIDTDIQTSSYTSQVFDRIQCNTAGGSFLIKFPKTPEDGDEMAVIDVSGTSGVNSIQLSGEGNKINNSTSIFHIDVNFTYIEFLFIGGSYNNWIVKEIPNTI